MKVLVISGFLGAGKTTFIKELVKRIDVPLAILENDYSNINIDKALLDDEENVYELTEGCICCSKGNDFATTVLTLANTLNPEVLIVEPTGLAKLKNIMDNISKVTYDRIELLEPVTLIDIENHSTFLKNYEDIYLNQIKYAGSLILTKNKDKNEESQKLLEELSSYIPESKILSTPYEDMANSWFDTLLKCKWNKKTILSKNIVEASEPVQSFSISDIKFNDYIELNSLMSAVMEGRFGNVIRTKGFFTVGSSFMKLDIVGKTITMEEINRKDSSQLVLIGENLNLKDLEILFSYYKNRE